MTTTVDMDTMRTKVLDALAALFPENIAANQVAVDAFMTAYGVKWSMSTREPIGQMAKGKKVVIGVYGGNTERRRNSSWVDVTMPCVIEVHAAKESGQDAVGQAKMLERYLGVVERVLRENKTLSGLIADLEVTSDSVDVDSPFDAQVDGALYFTVKFMQGTDDPRKGRA